MSSAAAAQTDETTETKAPATAKAEGKTDKSGKAPAFPLAKEAPSPAEPPKDSPQLLDARKKRSALGHLVDALEQNQRGGVATMIRRPGAALFVAFVAFDLGMAAASKMSKADVLRHAEAFRLQYPLAWGAACRADEGGFVRFLKIAGLVKIDSEKERQSYCVELQQLRSILASP
jgi:hypothetical protein